MDPWIRTNLRSGDRLGSGDNKLISGDVPDQARRAGSKGKPKPSTNNSEPDFTTPLEFSNPNPNPVDTGTESLSAQDERLLDNTNHIN